MLGGLVPVTTPRCRMSSRGVRLRIWGRSRFGVTLAGGTRKRARVLCTTLKSALSINRSLRRLELGRIGMAGCWRHEAFALQAGTTGAGRPSLVCGTLGREEARLARCWRSRPNPGNPPDLMGLAVDGRDGGGAFSSFLTAPSSTSVIHTNL